MAHKTACKVTLKNRDGETLVMDSMELASLHMGRSKKYLSYKKKKDEYVDDKGYWWWDIHDTEAKPRDDSKTSKCFECINYFQCDRFKGFGEMKVPECVPEDGYEMVDCEGHEVLRITKCYKYNGGKHLINMGALKARREAYIEQSNKSLDI